MPTQPPKMIRFPVSDFDRDFLFACRYAYYCLHRNIIPDDHYDQLEKRYRLEHGEEGTKCLPVGSSNKEDYTEAQKALAMYFIFSGRSAAPVDMKHFTKFF